MRALVVLYYWPPSGGPGVQRGVKLCRHLRELGIEPTVVTVDPAAYRLPGEYDADPTLASDVPDGLRVVTTPSGARTAARERLMRLRLFRAAQHFAPAKWFERQAGWLGPLTDALLREVRSARPDVLLTSSQPYTVHLAGREVRARTGVPWVADFRDPWTFAWGRSWPSARALRWEERREEDVLGDADVVIANTPGTRAEWLARRPWLSPEKVVVARNGYDEDDFGVAPSPRGSGEIRIVHAGSFRAKPPAAARRGLRALLDRGGPEPVPYELGTHSPLPMLRALAKAGSAASAVRLRWVGAVDGGWDAVARALGVADRVERTGYLAHRDTIAELLGASALWLPTITRRDGRSVSNVPAKTYEYLGSGRPVLAWAGPGDVADLMRDRDRCRTFDATGGIDALADEIVRIASGEGPRGTGPDPADAHPFRRRETARGVAAALRLAVGSAAPGRVDPAAPVADNPTSGDAA